MASIRSSVPSFGGPLPACRSLVRRGEWLPDRGQSLRKQRFDLTYSGIRNKHRQGNVELCCSKLTGFARYIDLDSVDERIEIGAVSMLIAATPR